jgi:hypothetical protein
MAKPKVVQQTVAEARDAFYEKAHRECGLSHNEIKEILVDRFDSFNLLRLDEYMVVLKEEAKERREQEAMKERRTALRNRIGEPIEPDPCPIVTCTGHKVKPDNGTHYEWVCSIGGLRHYLIDHISKVLQIHHEAFEIKLQEVSNAKAQASNQSELRT